MTSPGKWLDEGRFLPQCLRDFHDQKDVFKRLWRQVAKAQEKDAGYLSGLNWRDGHIFVIDQFLWFMAIHGYTLQRARPVSGFDFADLRTTIKEMKDEEAAELKRWLTERQTETGVKP